jgi:hypothetical protein
MNHGVWQSLLQKDNVRAGSPHDIIHAGLSKCNLYFILLFSLTTYVLFYNILLALGGMDTICNTLDAVVSCDT